MRYMKECICHIMCAVGIYSSVTLLFVLKSWQMNLKGILIFSLGLLAIKK